MIGKTPAERALYSLMALSVGDAIGETFFGSPPFVLPRIESRLLPEEVCPYTDDTEMAISIVEELVCNGTIDPDSLAKRFASRADYKRGYGRGAVELLKEIERGGSWRHLAPSLFNGRGSFGNGAAMRVAPLGAWFAHDLAAVVEMATLSAKVTHFHREGIAGAVAVAVAAAIAAAIPSNTIKFQNGSPDMRSVSLKFMDGVIELTPSSMVLDGIKAARELSLSTKPEEAAEKLGTGVAAHESVPFVIWSASHNLFSFEDAFWSTVRGLGDRDTTCAMVCGIVALSSGKIPEEMVSITEVLPSQ
jgi:ADP-ribosylglycohydrolase